MTKQRQINIRLDEDLYQMAKHKCKDQFGIGMGPLIKIFLKAFVSQRGVGFYIGDAELNRLFTNWLSKKSLEKHRKGCAPLPGPKISDIYKYKS